MMTIAVTNMLIRYVHTALNIHVVIHVRKYVNCNTCATHVRQTPRLNYAPSSEHKEKGCQLVNILQKHHNPREYGFLWRNISKRNVHHTIKRMTQLPKNQWFNRLIHAHHRGNQHLTSHQRYNVRKKIYYPRLILQWSYQTIRHNRNLSKPTTSIQHKHIIKHSSHIK